MGNKTNTIVVGSVVVAILGGLSIYYWCKNNNHKESDKKDKDKSNDKAIEGENTDTSRPSSDQEALIIKSDDDEKNKSV